MAGDRSRAGIARDEAAAARRAARRGQSFNKVRVATQDDIEANSSASILTLAAGSGIAITTNTTTNVTAIATTGAIVPAATANAVLVTDATGVMSWLDASAASNGDVLTKRDSADPQFEFAAPTGGSGGATFGTATIDFGAFPGSNEASVAVTGQAAILGTSKADVFVMASDTTADHTANDHRYAALLLAFSATTPDVGVGFTIHARCLDKMQGTFAVRWRWS